MPTTLQNMLKFWNTEFMKNVKVKREKTRHILLDPTLNHCRRGSNEMRLFKVRIKLQTVKNLLEKVMNPWHFYQFNPVVFAQVSGNDWWLCNMTVASPINVIRSLCNHCDRPTNNTTELCLRSSGTAIPPLYPFNTSKQSQKQTKDYNCGFVEQEFG